MPITNYSVLAGRPTAGKVVSGSSAHYQITMQANGGPFTVAVNIQSVDGSEVLYAVVEKFTPPDQAALTALPMGMTALASAPGGLALDFVREQIDGESMITQQQMTLLPKTPAKGAKGLSSEEAMRRTAAAAALQNAVVTLLNMTIADKDAVIYAFGSSYADSGKVDGIHDIHMNQGNPVGGKDGGFSGDNGIWQDGALFINLPSKSEWIAIFIAFQTESWTTDSSGNPA
jgi:uncharacterized protein YukJ